MLHANALCSVFLEARKTWVCDSLSVEDKPASVDESAVDATKGKAASVDAWAGASSGRTSEKGTATQKPKPPVAGTGGGAKKAADKRCLITKGGSTTGTWPPRCCAKAGRQPSPMRDKREA